jgi:hypothetical protein
MSSIFPTNGTSSANLSAGVDAFIAETPKQLVAVFAISETKNDLVNSIPPR